MKSEMQFFQDCKFLATNGAAHALHFTKTIEPFGKTHCKLSFMPGMVDGSILNSLKVEAQIYEHVLSALQKHTPHVPKWYETLDLPFDISAVTHEDWMDSYDTKRCMVLVLEHVNGSSNEHILDTPDVVFQVMYTLACFDRVGLRHCDMHLNNIMIDIMDLEKEFSYKVRDTTVKFRSRYMVKIVDFESSNIYHKDVERNTGSYSKIGINRGSDLKFFLSNFTRGLVYDWVRLYFPNAQIEIREEDQVLFQTSSILPSSEDIILKFVDSFPAIFSLSGEKAEYELPEESCVLPLPRSELKIGMMEIPPRLLLRNRDYDVEMRVLNYNWVENAWLLYQKCLDLEYPSLEKLLESCLKMTNIVDKSHFLSKLDKRVGERFIPPLQIEQKRSDYQIYECELN